MLLEMACLDMEAMLATAGCYELNVICLINERVAIYPNTRSSVRIAWSRPDTVEIVASATQTGVSGARKVHQKLGHILDWFPCWNSDLLILKVLPVWGHGADCTGISEWSKIRSSHPVFAFDVVYPMNGFPMGSRD